MNITSYGQSTIFLSSKPHRGADEVRYVFDVSGALAQSLKQPPHVHLCTRGRGHIFDSMTVMVTTPGEYAMHGATVVGIESFADKEGGAVAGRNTMYVLHTEDLVIAHLGYLGHEPSTKAFEKLTGIDILFVPVGSGTSLTVQEIMDIVQKIEPKIVIPLHVTADGQEVANKVEVQNLCQRLGQYPAPIESYNIKQKDLPTEGTVVVILEKML